MMPPSTLLATAQRFHYDYVAFLLIARCNVKAERILAWRADQEHSAITAYREMASAFSLQQQRAGEDRIASIRATLLQSGR